VLEHLLSYIDTRQRLGSFACVSRAWHAAAITATTSITDTKLGCQEEHSQPLDADDSTHLQGSRASSHTAWLQKHGTNLTQLTINQHCSSRHRVELSIPWQQLPQLRSLYITDTVLQQEEPSTSVASSSSSGGGNGLAALQELTRLELRTCTAPCTLSAYGLPALTNLRHLDISWVAAGEAQLPAAAAAAWAAEAGPEPGEAVAAERNDKDAQASPALVDPADLHDSYQHVRSCALGNTLKALTQLTCLELDSLILSVADLGGLSCLQQLQRLV
jgi:hypothetical protein